MKETTKKGILAFSIIIILLLIDQISKIWVKTHMSLYESIDVTNWFKINFVENPGMAFGIELGGKIFLTLFRIIVAIIATIYMFRLIHQKYKTGFIVCVALIIAGAAGNIFDSIFYGAIFSESYSGHIASFVPFGEGYSSAFHGNVVDMIYFPLFQGNWPDWMPLIGGQHFEFFRFIFNIADSCITIGVILLLLFYRKSFSFSLMSQKEKEKYLANKEAETNEE